MGVGGMSGLYIRNLFPDPRMRKIPSRLTFKGCRLESPNSVFEPAAGKTPGFTLKATKDGDNWAEVDIPLPANARLVLACGSSGAETSSGHSVSVWNSAGNIWLAATVQGQNGNSSEFTVPSNGQVKVTFRAAKTTGETTSVFNMFIGSPDDYQTLLGLGTSGFLSWDLMPITRA